MNASVEALFARRVRDRREALGWTPTTLADILGQEAGIGTDANAVLEVEAGDRMVRLNEAAALAKVLGTDLAWMISPDPSVSEATGNQRVAYHLARARRLRGLSQQEAARRLTEATGKPWTYATVSAAERTWETGRTRHFHADELAAFATVFNRPVEWFFEPIDASDMHRVAVEAQP